MASIGSLTPGPPLRSASAPCGHAALLAVTRSRGCPRSFSSLPAARAVPLSRRGLPPVPAGPSRLGQPLRGRPPDAAPGGNPAAWGCCHHVSACPPDGGSAPGGNPPPALSGTLRREGESPSRSVQNRRSWLLRPRHAVRMRGGATTDLSQQQIDLRERCSAATGRDHWRRQRERDL